MPEPVWTEQARHLRAAGMTLGRVAEIVGASPARVRRWTIGEDVREAERAACRRYKAEHREEIRAWESEYRDRPGTRPPCSRCGLPMGSRQAVADQPVCRDCRAAVQAERREMVERLWGEGVPTREIARRVGAPPASLQVDLVRMRELGYDLPYRYRNLKDPKHPELQID